MSQSDAASFLYCCCSVSLTQASVFRWDSPGLLSRSPKTSGRWMGGFGPHCPQDMSSSRYPTPGALSLAKFLEGPLACKVSISSAAQRVQTSPLDTLSTLSAALLSAHSHIWHLILWERSVYLTARRSEPRSQGIGTRKIPGPQPDHDGPSHSRWAALVYLSVPSIPPALGSSDMEGAGCWTCPSNC